MPPTSPLAAYIIPGREIAPAIELVTRAEALGYDSVWSRTAAAATRSSSCRPTGPRRPASASATASCPSTRHPVVMAQEALTLNELTRERFRLGLGVSHRAEAMLGLTLTEPLEMMREYVAVLRARLGAGACSKGGTSASTGAWGCRPGRRRR